MESTVTSISGFFVPLYKIRFFLLLTPSVQHKFRSVIQPVWDGFWVVFYSQLDSKLHNAKSACLIDLKFSGKIDFHKNSIHVKFGCKRPSM